MKSWKNAINALIAASLFWLKINPFLVIIIAAFLGTILYSKHPPSPAVDTMKKAHAPNSLLWLLSASVIAIVPYFDRMRISPYFSRVLTGILCSFVGLLLTVTIRFASNIPWDLSRLLMTGVAFLALLMKVDILWVILIGTGISWVIL